jgi:SagB-type dehydrogenase family enzyme
VEVAPEKDARRIALSDPDGFGTIGDIPLGDAIRNRQSRRRYTDAPLSLDELSFLLWATQGVRAAAGPAGAFRTVPSAGARHAFETHLFVRRVEGLAEGVYRYLPLEHELVFRFADEGIFAELSAGCFGQAFAAAGAVTFVWTVLPYRMEWRYGTAAHKVIAMDAGHVCQNLYLACEAVGAGTCAIGAYDQEKMDALLGVDGNDEFVVYIAPVGKV